MMNNLSVIRKRNGKIVPFDAEKITQAVSKAFEKMTGNPQLEVATQIKETTINKLQNLYAENETSIPYVEQIQDLVEQAIMEAGYYDIAKHYILYRHEKIKERALVRQQELQKIEEGGAVIINRNGKQERFNEVLLRDFLSRIVKGYEHDVSVEAIVGRVKMEIYDGISSEDFQKALVLAARSMVENDPSYTYVAARLVRYNIFKEAGANMNHETYNESNIKSFYKTFFLNSTKEGVDVKIYDERLMNFDLNRLAEALKPERDELFQYLGMQVVQERYLTRHLQNKNKLLELPQTFWMRVAMGLAINETNKNERAIEFYNLMSTLRLIPSTPTLFQAGYVHSQLSSCYLNTIDDTLESLAKVTYADNAQLSKYSGGIATDWSYIRGMGSIVKKTQIESNGIIPFMKVANDVTVAINRSGRRRGAVCAYLETWHIDVEDFLDLRKNTGDERRRTHDMNTANWIPDLFMERVKNNGEWTLFSPDETRDLHETYGQVFRMKYESYERMAKEGKLRIHKTMKAKDLFKKMITMIFETGHPWFTFKDPCNIRSPQDHVGVIHNSNLCTEITLNNSFDETAVCNLSSINLPRHFANGKIDLEMLKDTIRTAMRMLDNVIDINFYPTIEGKTSNMKHRPVGLGIMGFHDALYELGINYDSADALKFADENQEFISYYAILASTELARERGAYQTFKGSKWDRGIMPVDTLALLEAERGTKIPVPKTGKMDWTEVKNAIKMYGMRNSNTMAIAPTATISNIAGSSPCIEAYYKNIYVKSNMSGEFTMVNDYLVADLKKLGLWNDEMLSEIKQNEGSVQNISRIPDIIKAKYKETFEIDSKVFINLAAFRGKWIDQSQSLNLFYKGTSGREIGDMYIYAWDMGLKTTYYLRTLAASSIEKATTSLKTSDKKPEPEMTKTNIPAPQPEMASVYAQPIPFSSPQTNHYSAQSLAGSVPLSTATMPSSIHPTPVTEPTIPYVTTTYSEVEHALNVVKEKTRTEAHTLNAMMENVSKQVAGSTGTGTGTATIKVNGQDVKICKILDPDCEACQ
jgi:ribonucleoside-diphosphate reductase alpha chain